MIGTSLQGKRVFVTGGSGVIGRELLQMLQDSGSETLNIDREPLPAGDWSGIRHLQYDLYDCDLQPVVDFKPEVVFHLAAAFERSEETPEFWPINWHDNVVVTHRIADLTRSLQSCRTVVFSSSYLTYSPELYLSSQPSADYRLLAEADPVNPRNLCGMAKLAGEQEFAFIQRYFRPDFRVISARIFRVYGLDSIEIINRWTRDLLTGSEISVYKRENRFDYIFSRDVAEGLIRLVDSNQAGGVVNLSSSESSSIGDVINLLQEMVPESGSRIVEESDPGRYETSQGDISKLIALTDWKPQTTLEKGVAMVVSNERGKQTERA